MDSILDLKIDRIYRILRIFLIPVSRRNRKWSIRFAENVLFRYYKPEIYSALLYLMMLYQFVRRQADKVFTVSSGNREIILTILLILSKNKIIKKNPFRYNFLSKE